MRYGAAAGLAAVVLFVAAALITGERPGFDAPAGEVAAWFVAHRTRTQLSCALVALSAPLFVWFLATATALAARRSRRSAAIAFGCGTAWIAVFMVDIAALAVAALRPHGPETSQTLVDLEFLLMGTGAFLVVGMLAAFALALEGAIGRLAALAALLYALRVGILFTTDGAFAADGVLGLYVPAGALAAWIAAAGALLLVKRGADSYRGPDAANAP